MTPPVASTSNSFSPQEDGDVETSEDGTCSDSSVSTYTMCTTFLPGYLQPAEYPRPKWEIETGVYRALPLDTSTWVERPARYVRHPTATTVPVDGSQGATKSDGGKNDDGWSDVNDDEDEYEGKDEDKDD